MIRLTIEVASVSVANVWDLPLWAWRQYADYVDALEAAERKAANQQQQRRT